MYALTSSAWTGRYWSLCTCSHSWFAWTLLVAHATGQLQSDIVEGPACIGPYLREVRAYANCAVGFIHRQFDQRNQPDRDPCTVP